MTHFERTADKSVDHGGRMEVASNLQWYQAALLILIAWSTYTSVPLLSGGRLLVPSFPTVALIPVLLLTAWQKVSKADEVFLLKITFVLLLSMLLSPGYEYLQEKFLGLIQCSMAIGVTILTVRLMQQMRRESLERTLLVLWCLIVFGCILEVVGLTRDISDSFREWAYVGMFTLIDSDLRDINMVGWARPKLFSSEPSHVTKFFIAAINSWLLVRVTWNRVAVVAGATLAMIVIMGSPMLVVSAAITVAIVLWDRRAHLRTKVAMILATLLIGGLFGVYSGGSVYSSIANRLMNVGPIQVGDDLSSEDSRIVYPYVILVDTWRRWPLFGVGISGKEVVLESGRFGDDLGNNAMAEMWTYLGLVGGVLFIYVLLRQAYQTGVDRLGLLVVTVALFSQLMGGFVAFRSWGFIALIWGALAVADTQANLEAGQTHK